MDHDAFSFVCMMLSLAAAFALDPLAPILMFGVCLRLGVVGDPALLAAPFAPFASLAFIGAAGTLYLLHAAMDKIPPVAHALDVVGIVFKPLGIALLGAALLQRLSPVLPIHWTLAGAVLCVAVLGGAAIHVLRAKIRLAASAATLGVAHPLLSAVENVVALLLSLAALTHPVLACFLMLVVVLAPMLAILLFLRAAARAARRLGSGIWDAMQRPMGRVRGW